DFAGVNRVEKGRRQPRQMREDIAAKVGNDALAERDNEVEAHGRCNGEYRANADEKGEVLSDRRTILTRKAMVDHPTDRHRQHERRPACKQKEDQSSRNEPAITRQVRDEFSEGRQRPTAFRPWPIGNLRHDIPSAHSRFAPYGLVTVSWVMYRPSEPFQSRSLRRPRLQVSPHGRDCRTMTVSVYANRRIRTE